MSFADNYFSKNHNFIPHIEEPPSGLLRFVIVIPAYLEDGIFGTLESVENADLPDYDLEILIVVNYSQTDSEENKQKNLVIYDELKKWCRKHTNKRRAYYPMLASDLPKKHAGVGLARKIGMDEALWRFNIMNMPRGLILSLDADSLIESNYFLAFGESLITNNNLGGCLLYFEHPTQGKEYTPEVYDAIIQYELHLRYYKHILQYIGFPYANYTIGSCFGVKAGFYAQHGGMNRRQAGEEFYFLHKLFPHREFAEITETCVHPSPRPSQRVPFGTGASVTNIIAQKNSVYETYCPLAFFDLQKFLSSLEKLYHIDNKQIKEEIEQFSPAMREFLRTHDFSNKIVEIKANTSSFKSFTKRFFYWFDGFKVVKYLNFSHENYYKKLPVEQAVADFFKKIGYKTTALSLDGTLHLFRKLDREKKSFFQLTVNS